MKLLIALPCYNEAEKIATVLRSIPTAFTGIAEHRLLVVDDGSSDDTAPLALAAGAMVVRHKQNKGLGQAFRSAVDYAIDHGFDLMVNMDGDGQFDDATGATATTFMLATTTVSVKVTDSHGRSDIQGMLVTVSPAPDLIFANGFDALVPGARPVFPR